jgi:hypothetical protein
MRETLDFVAPHFHMGVPILLATIRTSIGLESHGFHSLWFLVLLLVFWEFVVH